MSGVLSPSGSLYRSFGRGGLFLVLALGLGAAGGVLWERLVVLPTYTIASDGSAATTERGLAAFIGGDATFVIIGAVAGVILGVTAWRRFRSVGWTLVLLVLVAALVAALTCWFVGYRLGPGEFAPRLAAAQPGDVVPIELTLRARVSLLTWPFFAIIPVLLGSSLGRDDEDPQPLFGRRRPEPVGAGPTDG